MPSDITSINTDNNLLQHTDYKNVVATGVVPLLKPQRIYIDPVNGNIPLPYDIQSFADTGFTGQGSVIAILDTGVFEAHPDLVGKVILKTNYKGETKSKDDIDDLYGHGTHLAGIIAASQSQKINLIGIAHEAQIVSVKVTDCDDGTTSWVKIAKGVEQVLKYNGIGFPNDGVNVGSHDIVRPDHKPKVTCILIAFNGYDIFNGQMITDVSGHHLFTLFQICYENDIPVIVSSGNHYPDFCEKVYKKPFFLTLLRRMVNVFRREENRYIESTETPGIVLSKNSFIETQGLAYPAFCDDVISAGAICNTPGKYDLKTQGFPPQIQSKPGDLAIFSQRKRTVKPDKNHRTAFICAAGVDMISTDNVKDGTSNFDENGVEFFTSGYTKMSGTSQAAAVVAGNVLLLQQALKSGGRRIATMELILKNLFNGSDDVDYGDLGKRLNRSVNAKRYHALNIIKSIKNISYK